jgi:hypothetical protein
MLLDLQPRDEYQDDRARADQPHAIRARRVAPQLTRALYSGVT